MLLKCSKLQDFQLLRCLFILQVFVKMHPSGISNINRSYFIGNDTEFGWGVRTFFTFYGEFQRKWPPLKYIEATVLFCIFIIGIVGNILVILIICKSPSMRSVTNYFMANLASSGILFLAFIPLVLVTRISETWILGSVICRLVTYTQACSGVISIWTMTFISIDRYKYIMCPVQAWKPATVKFVVAGLWILTFILNVPLAAHFITLDFPFRGDTITICTLVWPNFKFRMSQLFVFIVVLLCYLLPLIILSVNYFRILNKLLKNRRKITLQRLNCIRHLGGSPDNLRTQLKFSRIIRDFKAVKMLILIVLVFCVMWLPVFIAFTLIMYDGITNKLIMTSQTFLACMCVAFCNACVNPFLYGLLNDRFKVKLRRLCSCCKQRKSKVRPLGPAFIFR